MSKVETAYLRPDHEISRIIKGGWQLSGGHGAVDKAAAIADMEAFLDAGIFTFDCADIYTGVEEMIGDFIADVRARRGHEVADRVCVHTKLVPDLSRLADITHDEIEAIIDRSLKRLKIDQLHLVQYFWWDMAAGDPVRAFEVLTRLQEKGKIRHLGVTNWDVADTERFLSAGIEVVSSQIQYSLLDRRAENGLSQWAATNDVALICYGVLAGGFLTDQWLGQADPGFTFENRSLIKYRLIIEEFGGWQHFQSLLSVMDQIAKKHGVSISAVAIRHMLDRPNVGGVIVGARYARHLPRTVEAMNFTLDADDQTAIAAILAAAQGPNGRVFELESDRNGRHGRIMKYNLNNDPNAKTLVDGG